MPENLVSVEKRVENNPLISIWVKRNLRILALVIATIILCVIFSFINPVFIRIESMMNLIRKISVLSVVSIGMTMVILTGGIDLSIGSSLALTGACAAIVLKTTGNAAAGILCALMVAGSIGVINGIIIGRIKINSIVFTLAMFGIARSLALVVSRAATIRVGNEAFNWLGSFTIDIGSVTIPVALFLIIALYLLFNRIFCRSPFGKRVAAIGGNPDASRFAGINIENNLMFVYLITGLLVGVASIIAVGRASSAAPLAGYGLEFEAVTAVIIGGASVSGGKADLMGTLVGVIFVGVLFSGLSLSQVNAFYFQFIKGILLLAAVITNTYFDKRQMKY